MGNKIELKPNQTILFTGDSITAAGRGEPAYGPLGYGYVHFAGNMLLARYPQLNLNIINTGVSGNTIEDLKGRWRRDCIEHQPDILSVLIGVNDVWFQHTSYGGAGEQVYFDEYESTYRQLLSTAREECGCRFVLAEPFMFCSDRENQMFKDLQVYIEAVHTMAEEFDAVLVPLQKQIDEQIGQVPDEKWSADSVHPYLWTHAWIAQRWLEATNL